ncbi:hypothetical protein R3W88_025794 [Solanum pinnatisectum]|uniref:F-box domain-containing protein n=1 Tax=Solanum pinnatisectum TaxID=50273 RepID=A0AAV9M488_9SOLN|nr:hypothetical protein R3W88_025794 [Solanum pinnatisectum]
MAINKSDFDEVTCIVPSDIQYLILINVPIAKSLLRFKSVSKSWNVIISDNEFKKIHHDESKALGREKLLLLKQSTNEFGFREKFRKAKVLCSCDGLVVLKNLYKTYVLWNPSIREYKTLACPYFSYNGKVPNSSYKNYALWNPSTRYQYRTLTCPHNHLYYNNLPRRVSACGLCYDSSVDDYKVILIYDFVLRFPCPVRRLPPRDIVSSGISLEGCVFWSLNYGEVRLFVVGASTIIYFDVKSDEMKSLPTPDFVDCLSLYGGNIHSVVLDIWIMQQDGSWKLLMSISHLPSICKKFVQDRVLL